MGYIVAHEVPELALEVDRRAVAFDNKDTELKKCYGALLCIYQCTVLHKGLKSLLFFDPTSLSQSS